MFGWMKKWFGRADPVIQGIVAATGASANSLAAGGKSLAKQIEQAMVDAILVCNAAGITDPTIIKTAMLKAREQVKQELLNGSS